MTNREIDPDLSLEEVPIEGNDDRGFFSSGGLIERGIKILGIFAFASILMVASLISYDYFHSQKKFPANTYIGRVEVSGLSLANAEARLRSFPVSSVFASLITLETVGVSFAFPPDQLGVQIMYDESVKKAFGQAHQESYLKNLKERLNNQALYAPLILNVDDNTLKEVLSELTSLVNCPSQDAAVLFFEETGGYHISPEIIGRELLIDKSQKLFKIALYKGETTIPLAATLTSPRVTEKVLRADPPVHRISAYTTYYGSHDSPNRIHNIKLIASWLDGLILLPGDEFSLVAAIGDFTEERGFKEAYVIVGGELVPQLGGGTCQIGTTLYNTLELADVKITQRSNHSFYFNIYPLGRDAAIYPGQKDLRFVNDTGTPLLLKAVATDKRLSFRLYGTPSGKQVTFSSPVIMGKTTAGEYEPMSLRRVIDEDLPFRTKVVRTVKDKDGKTIKEETIGSFYKLYGEKTNVPIRRPESR